jgi:hypothetical protein
MSIHFRTVPGFHWTAVTHVHRGCQEAEVYEIVSVTVEN